MDIYLAWAVALFVAIMVFFVAQVDVEGSDVGCAGRCVCEKEGMEPTN